MTATEIDVRTETIITLTPGCEARLEGRYACAGTAYAIVRFKAHGCDRDGCGVLLCQPCLDWIATGQVGCGVCGRSAPEGELFIVGTVKL